jgi:hypothetical protein
MTATDLNLIQTIDLPALWLHPNLAELFRYPALPLSHFFSFVIPFSLFFFFKGKLVNHTGKLAAFLLSLD